MEHEKYIELLKNSRSIADIKSVAKMFKEDIEQNYTQFENSLIGFRAMRMAKLNGFELNSDITFMVAAIDYINESNSIFGFTTIGSIDRKTWKERLENLIKCIRTMTKYAYLGDEELRMGVEYLNGKFYYVYHNQFGQEEFEKLINKVVEEEENETH